jgi:hypothetical protein
MGAIAGDRSARTGALVLAVLAVLVVAASAGCGGGNGGGASEVPQRFAPLAQALRVLHDVFGRRVGRTELP